MKKVSSEEVTKEGGEWLGVAEKSVGDDGGVFVGYFREWG